MCCFSRPIRHVSSTSIFARELAGGRQLLVYSMNFDADEELAMILPLPVPPGVDERAVEFIDLEGYARFFRDLERAFPPAVVALGRGRGPLAAAPKSPPRLTVHRVGRFEASFVPTRADFERLDPRFQLAPDVWDSLPQYRDYGFAVFKLRPSRRPLGRLFKRLRRQTAHPMAFSFPRRAPSTMFFPTVHVHDGTAPARADFDHTLYCQPGPAIAATVGWERSTAAVGAFVDDRRARGVVDPAARCFRALLHGSRANRDVTLTPPEDLELALLRPRGECFALTIRATAAYDEIAHPQRRDWHATATRHLNALARGLRDELLALERSRRARWRLTPYDESLRELWVNGERLLIPGLWDRAPPEDAGPARLRFTLQSERVEPQQLWLAFSHLPDATLLRELQAELRAVLESVAARLSS